MSRSELEASLRRDHRDEESWTVYADLLTNAGDSRGELITLEQLIASSDNSEDLTRWRQRATALFKREHERWLGPLIKAPMEPEWFRGFIIEALISARPAWVTSTLLELDTSALLFWLTYTRLATCESVASIIADSWIDTVELRWPQTSDLLPLAAITHLQTFIVEGSDPLRIQPLAELPRLEQLLLRRVMIHDFDALGSGFSALRHLAWTTPWHDSLTQQAQPIEALAKLCALEVLEISGPLVGPLHALSGLTRLREINLPSYQVADIEPLLELPALERLYLRNLELPPAQLEALRERGIELNNYSSR